MRSGSLTTPLKRAIQPGVKIRGWGRLLHLPLPMSECRGKYCHLRQRFQELQVHNLALPLLPRPKILRGGLLSLRWRLCPSVWSPPTQSAEPPPSIVEDLGRKRPEADGDEDSLLSNAELATGAISSIIRDFDLKRSGALPIEEALALSIQGVTSVSSRVLICLP